MLEDILTEDRLLRLGADARFEDRWPVVVFAANGMPPKTAAEVLIEVMDELFARKEPFAMITDMRNMKVPEIEVRRMLGEYQSSHNDSFTRYMVADAHVIGNTFVRGLVTIINWFGAPGHPQGFFKTIEEAEEWCRDKLAHASASD